MGIVSSSLHHKDRSRECFSYPVLPVFKPNKSPLSTYPLPLTLGPVPEIEWSQLFSPNTPLPRGYNLKARQSRKNKQRKNENLNRTGKPQSDSGSEGGGSNGTSKRRRRSLWPRSSTCTRPTK